MDVNFRENLRSISSRGPSHSYPETQTWRTPHYHRLHHTPCCFRALSSNIPNTNFKSFLTPPTGSMPTFRPRERRPLVSYNAPSDNGDLKSSLRITHGLRNAFNRCDRNTIYSEVTQPRVGTLDPLELRHFRPFILP